MDNFISKVEKILNNNLPNDCFINVWKRNNFYSQNSIGIMFAVNDYDVNNVKLQKPQIVSLSLDHDTMELSVQMFNGSGGQHIYRKPFKDNPKEKNLAMVGIKIPFRKPQKNEKSVLKAIDNFSQRWVKTISDNIDNLTDKQYADYSKFNLHN